MPAIMQPNVGEVRLLKHLAESPVEIPWVNRLPIGLTNTSPQSSYACPSMSFSSAWCALCCFKAVRHSSGIGIVRRDCGVFGSEKTMWVLPSV